MKQLPNKIRQFRLKNKLTQQQLADKLKVNITTVQRWEAGIIRDNHIVLVLLESSSFSGEPVQSIEVEDCKA